MTTTRRMAVSRVLGTLIGAATLASFSKVSARTTLVSDAAPEVVAYLTRSGNTRVFAAALARTRGADLHEIRTRISYPADYEAHVALASQQRRNRDTPELAGPPLDLTGRRIVYLGFPIWGEALPAPIRSFLTTHDIGDRTLVPLVTHGGFGPGSALETVAELAPNARILPAFVQECDQERRQLQQLSDWFGPVSAEL